MKSSSGVVHGIMKGQQYKRNSSSIPSNMFPYASNIHGNNTRYAAKPKHNLYKPKVRTNVGKQLISSMATDIWKDLPTPSKKLIQSVSAFPNQIIRYLLSEQQMN